MSVRRRCIIYAIVETGGKQYRVTPGQVVDVDRMDATEGEPVELDRVLLVADGNEVTVGKPTVEGAKVIARSRGQTKAKKIIVFKYKPKVRYRRKLGHRQLHTRLAIEDIIGPEVSPGKTRRRRREVAEDGA